VLYDPLGQGATKERRSVHFFLISSFTLLFISNSYKKDFSVLAQKRGAGANFLGPNTLF